MRRVNIHKILAELFKYEKQETDNIYNTIVNEQFDLNRSPNFFYKGKVYIQQKQAGVKPLDDTLRDRFDGYLSIYNHANTNLKRLTSLVTTAMVRNPPEYLYYLFPKQAHQLLYDSGIYMPSEEPANLAEFLPDTLPEIDMLIKEQLLNSLI